MSASRYIILGSASELYQHLVFRGKIPRMIERLFPRGIPLSKRFFDLFLSIPGVIIISPLILLISLIILVVEGPPIFFCQPRPGYRGKIFRVYKFRTMQHLVDTEGRLLPDGQRLTGLGRFLRSFSLDELPEILNILKGEMSLVGPRPLLVSYLDRYSPHQARRHEVLPGITGWAQINGRNIISWKDKFNYDVWYVDHWSLWLDIKILLLTLWKTIKREGISQPGQATVEEFKGNDE